MRHFPLRSTRSERLFAFSVSVDHFFFWGQVFRRVVSRSGKNGREPVVLFVCLLVRQEGTSVVIYTQSLYHLFDIIVHLSRPIRPNIRHSVVLNGTLNVFS